MARFILGFVFGLIVGFVAGFVYAMMRRPASRSTLSPAMREALTNMGRWMPDAYAGAAKECLRDTNGGRYIPELSDAVLAIQEGRNSKG